MSDLPQPLTPADCDLKDFPYLPVDVHRLLTSETWVLGNLDERAAAMALWLASWHQVPAGSVPKDDRMLAHLSQSGPKWKKLKTHALRGWVEADDRRLYHPVVAEKALEAWVEKLAFSLSGSAGNAKRWGVSIETDSIRGRALVAITMLRALAPQSKILKKKAVAIIEAGSHGDSGGDDKGSGGDAHESSGGDSGGDRKGYVIRDTLDKDTEEAAYTSTSVGAAPPSAERLGQICVLFRRKGINLGQNALHNCAWVSNPKATDALIIEAIEIAKQRKPNEPIGVAYVKPIIADLVAKAEAESAPPVKDWD